MTDSTNNRDALMAVHPRIVVVGAGIVGASIAWHLARDGARVTVIDAAEPGGVATRLSWAWINASWGNPEPYFRLRVRAMAEWRRLERDVPAIRVAWVGGLLWDLPPDRLDAFAAQHTGWGYDIRRVEGAEIARLEPHLATPPEFALHAPREGVVEPLATARALLAAAEGLGAKVIGRTRFQGVDLSDGRVVGARTDAGLLQADQVVVAAGVGAANLLAEVGVTLPMRHAPALFLATKPRAARLRGLLIAPGMELRQTTDGAFIAVTGFDAADPDGHTGAAALLARMQGMIATDEPIEADFHAIANRPMPGDGFPVVGRVEGVPGLSVAVTHSGITLAPAIGQFVAEDLLTGQCAPLLAPYGLPRFR